MNTEDLIVFGIGAALGWYWVRHRMRTGSNV